MRVHIDTGLAKRPSLLKRLFRAFASCPHDNLMLLTYSRSLMCVDCAAVAPRNADGLPSCKFKHGDGSSGRIAHVCAVWLACLAVCGLFWYFALAILVRAIHGTR